MTTLTSLVSAVNTNFHGLSNFHGCQVPRQVLPCVKFRAETRSAPRILLTGHRPSSRARCTTEPPDLGVSLSAIDIALGHAQVRRAGLRAVRACALRRLQLVSLAGWPSISLAAARQVGGTNQKAAIVEAQAAQRNWSIARTKGTTRFQLTKLRVPRSNVSIPNDWNFSPE
jgi:hypothetical protein